VGVSAGSREVPGRKPVTREKKDDDDDDDDDDNNNNNAYSLRVVFVWIRLLINITAPHTSISYHTVKSH
jgi:hypothetical protein